MPNLHSFIYQLNRSSVEENFKSFNIYSRLEWCAICFYCEPITQTTQCEIYWNEKMIHTHTHAASHVLKHSYKQVTTSTFKFRFDISSFLSFECMYFMLTPFLTLVLVQVWFQSTESTKIWLNIRWMKEKICLSTFILPMKASMRSTVDLKQKAHDKITHTHNPTHTNIKEQMSTRKTQL